MHYQKDLYDGYRSTEATNPIKELSLCKRAARGINTAPCGNQSSSRILRLAMTPLYRGGPHMRSLISIDFPAPEKELESAYVVSAVSVP